MNHSERESVIVRTSFIGILTNIGLASVKAVLGLLTNSIAVTMDAVNNFSDALSSVVTIVGTKLSMRSPDKKHPISKKDIMEALPDISQTTVEACLHRLLKVERIEKIGGNRNARYRRKSLRNDKML